MVFIYLYLFTCTGVQHDFHIRGWPVVFTETRQITLVKQELRIILDRLRSLLIFCGVHVAQYLAFCVLFYTA